MEGSGPRDADSLFNASIALFDQGQDAAAVAALNKAIQLAGMTAACLCRFGAGLLISNSRAAYALFDKAIGLDGGADAAWAYFGRAGANMELGNRDAAIADYSASIRITPNWNAYSNRGAALADAGDVAGAISDFTAAMALSPDDAWSYIKRGALRHELGDHAGAILDFCEAVRLWPDHAETYRSRAKVFEAIEDWDEAIADYGEVLRINPGDTDAYRCRAIARAESGDDEGVIVDCSAAIALDATWPSDYAFRGGAKRRQGDYGGAVLDYAEMLRLVAEPKAAEAAEAFAADLRDCLAGALKAQGTTAVASAAAPCLFTQGDLDAITAEHTREYDRLVKRFDDAQASLRRRARGAEAAIVAAHAEQYRLLSSQQGVVHIGPALAAVVDRGANFQTMVAVEAGNSEGLARDRIEAVDDAMAAVAEYQAAIQELDEVAEEIASGANLFTKDDVAAIAAEIDGEYDRTVRTFELSQSKLRMRLAGIQRAYVAMTRQNKAILAILEAASDAQDAQVEIAAKFDAIQRSLEQAPQEVSFFDEAEEFLRPKLPPG